MNFIKSQGFRLGKCFSTILFLIFLGGSGLWADNLKNDSIQSITDSNFNQNVLMSPKPVLVDFWASWCPNCCRLSPTMEKIVSGFGVQLKVAKVDVAQNPLFPRKFGVDMLPTILVFNHGKVVERWVGNISESNLRNGIEKVLKSN